MQLPFELKLRHILGVLLVYHCLVSFYYSYTGELMDSWGYYKEMMDSNQLFFSTSPFYVNSMKILTYIFSIGGVLSYPVTNLVFAILSFIGVYLTLITIVDTNEKISLRSTWPYLLLFLPSWHYWTARIGKEAILILSLGLILFGIFNRLKSTKFNFLLVVIGILFSFTSRAHFLGILMLGALLAHLLLSSYGTKNKILLFSFGCIGLYFFADVFMSIILKRTGFNITEVTTLIKERANTIGSYDHNYSNLEYEKYSFQGKLFTFLFRPFFEQKHYSLLLISLENLIFMLASISLLRFRFLTWIKKSNPIFITIILYIIGSSLLMSQISSNMGYANRQKSSILLCFIILFIGFYTNNYKVLKKTPLQKQSEK